MIQLRKAQERGHFDHGWLNTFHTFSFADYYDAAHMGFRALRVINEDRVKPSHGFGTHGHRDMEIITYVLEGALEHKDSLGSGSVLRPGELQHMTAGIGIQHSEFNPSSTEAVHLYQIWIVPESRGLRPSYEQQAFPEAERHGRLRVVASPDGRDGSLTIHQDVKVFLCSLDNGQQVTHELAAGRHAWVQILRGGVQLDRSSVGAGDGVAISAERAISLQATSESEIMLFDLP
jgi:redox-sensitive bicupin YhaK (pirin superfamily)